MVLRNITSFLRSRVFNPLRRFFTKPVVRTITKRKPLKIIKIHKLEVMKGYILFSGPDSPDYVQIRVYQFRLGKPQQKTVNKIRSVADQLFEEKREQLLGEYERVIEQDSFNVGLLHKMHIAIPKNAEEVREVELSEKTIPFNQYGVFISNEGEYRLNIKDGKLILKRDKK